MSKEVIDENVHVVPVHSDEPEHANNKDCWCEPEVEKTEGVDVVIHRRTQ